MINTKTKDRRVYVPCVILATVYWLVKEHSRMDEFASNLYFLLLPLTGTPYLIWVVQGESREPEGYFKTTYGGHAGLMWGVRVFALLW